MQVSVISDRDGLLSAAGEWTSLLEKSSGCAVSLTPEWTAAWWDNFGADNRMHLVVVRHGGALVGVAPMMEAAASYRGVHIRKITMMANGHSPVVEFVTDRAMDAEVQNAILSHLEALPGIDMIELPHLNDNGSACAPVLDYIKERGLRYGIKRGLESPYIPIDTDWETFFRSKHQKFRKAIRHKLNRAAKCGGVSVAKATIMGAADHAVEEMFSISGKSWKKKAGTDLLSDGNASGFYRSLCDALGPKGLISIWLLRKDSVPIAFEFHITHNGVVYPLRADYDESYADISPGSVLEYSIAKSLFEEARAREYYSCGHTYMYLLNWSKLTRKHVTIEIFSGNIRSTTLHIIEYKIIPCLRRLGMNKVLS
ncbi:MAG: GNAT family N-acetyltransferase [Deltaproteobacteria bacterium]|nr:GNAT family N-acetyltransferase [Deltaproteobacteria bacterium]